MVLATEGRSAESVILGVRPSEFILLEFQSPSRRIFIGSHSLHPLSSLLIGPSTFDETQPCNSSVFECAGDDEVGKKIFEYEEDDAGEDDGDDGEAQATHVHSTFTTTTRA
jgi:hypothetical protein